MVLRFLGALLSGVGAVMFQSTPTALHGNICSWRVFSPCPPWLDSGLIDDLILFTLWAAFAGFAISIIFPWIKSDYQRTQEFINPSRQARRDPDLSTTPVRAPDRMPMISFLAEAQNHGWSILGPGSQINEFSAAIKQAGHDGVLVFSGRPIRYNIFSETIRNETLRPIPPDHWDEFRFDWTTAVQLRSRTFEIDGIATDNFPTLTSKWTHEKGYADLHVERSSALAWLKSSAVLPTVSNTDSRRHATNSDSDRLMPLFEAVMWAYEQIRKLSKYEPYIRIYENTPAKLPGLAAQLIFNRAVPPITIYGIYPPRAVIDEIPAEHMSTWRFSDDAKELIDQFNDQRRYKNLQVKRADIERRIKDLRG